MSARLGNVLYWFGCLMAGLCVACGLAALVYMKGQTNAYDVEIAPIVGGAIAAFGLIPWLIGRACKYVLSGE